MSGSINQGLTISAAPAPVPVVTSDAPGEVGSGQSVQIGTISAATAFIPLSVVFVGDAPQGTLSVNAQDQVIYTAPGKLLPGGVDSFTYEVEDSIGGVSTPVSVSLALDQGPTATDPTLVVSHDRAFDLSQIVNELATPGLAGDTLSLTSVSAAAGTIVQQGNGDFVYAAISNGASGGAAGKEVALTGTDTVSYTVTDQLGDSVTGTAIIDIDPGPTLAAGSTVVGHGQTVDLASTIEDLITPGLPGDTETIMSVSAQSGQVSAGTGANGQYQIEYTAPAGGSDVITYKVKDQAGDIVSGTLTVSTDPGPAATDPSFVIGHAGTIDLSTMASSLAAPGLAGDTLTVTAVSAANGTVVRNAAGDFIYQPSATGSTESLLGIAVGAAPNNHDSITYTVADQYGDTVTGTAAITIDPGPTVAPGQLVVGHGQTVNLASTIEGLITPGLPGDTEEITGLTAQQSKISVVGSAIDYTAPVSGSDTVSFTVKDSNGDTAPGSIAITVDPGPAASDPSLVVGHAGTIDLSTIADQLAMPGLTGDTLTVTAASAASGTIMQNKAGDFIYQPISSATGDPITVGYNLIADATTQNNGPVTSGYDLTDAKGTSNPGFGSDTITYTVTDQLGDTVTGFASLTVDPGPTAIDPTLEVGHGGTLDLSSIVGQLAMPGLKSDTLTLTAASAANGTIFQTKVGDLVYEALSSGSPTTVGYNLSSDNPNDGQATTSYDLTGNATGAGTMAAFSSDVVTYTVSDQLGDTITGTADISIDPGPSITAGTTVVVQAGHTMDLTSAIANLISPGLAGDTDTVISASAQSGSVIVTGGSDGGYDVRYTAPASGNDALTFEVQDQNGDTATGTVAIVTDPGPILASGSYAIGHGQSTNLLSYLESLITPGAPGLTDTITSVQATHGQTELVSSSGFGGGTTLNAIDYTAPASGNDTLTYTVTDQNGISTTGTVAVTVDPGPQLVPGSLVVGHGQTVNLTSTLETLITPGEPGDTDTITGATAETGKASYATFGYSKGGAEQVSVGYTAPAQGNDVLSYTVTDQLGDTAAGSVAITVDPGPTAGNVSVDVNGGQSIDLTQQIVGADQAGLAGDTLTLIADNAQGTLGNVSLVNGDLVYTASNAAFAQLAAGAAAGDSFTYTVSDQYGDQATGTVTLNVSNPVVTVNGGEYGGSTIQGPAGNAVINAFGWGNTIVAGGGNDTINAGQGSAAVNAGSGNVTVNLNGYNNTVTGGDGSDSVAGSLGNTSVTLGNGNDAIKLGGYGNAITVGNGNDTIVAGAGSDTVVGGSGTDEVSLQGYQDSVSFTGGNDTITGGAGSDTFDLTGGNASLALSGSSDMVFLHSTNASIMDAGQGTQIQISGGGTDVIQGAGSDPSLLVDLTGGLGGYTSASAVLASLTSDGNGRALLSLGASQGSLDFAGVAPSALHAANFRIG